MEIDEKDRHLFLDLQVEGFPDAEDSFFLRKIALKKSGVGSLLHYNSPGESVVR